jgi:hypothetical protein
MATEKSRPPLHLDEIDSLVDKKILEAKLAIAEKRFNYLLAMGALLLTVFGIVLPMFLASQSTERVDRAIDRMESSFSQLAGKQLRKPEITCVVDGRNLQDSVLTFTQNSNRKIIEVKNTGDGTAEFIEVRLYVRKTDDSVLPPTFLDTLYDPWRQLHNDEPDYTHAFVKEIDKGVLLPAQSLLPVTLVIYVNAEKKIDAEVPTMLKIFYGEPEPKRIRFGLRVVSAGKETK